MESELKESSWNRAKRDTKTWLLGHIYTWFLAFLFPAGINVIVTYLSPPDLHPVMISFFSLIAGLLGLLLLLLITFSTQLIKAPYKQRDESRNETTKLKQKLSQPDLFDLDWNVNGQSRDIFIAKNELNDWVCSLEGSIGLRPITLVSNYDTLTLESLSFVPSIRFVRSDAYRSTNAISIELPLIQTPSMQDTLGIRWEITNTGLWNLDGLPLNTRYGENLVLPQFMLRIVDCEEVGKHFDADEQCVLVLRIAMRTNRGSQEIPKLSVELKPSIIQNIQFILDAEEKANKSSGN